MYYSHIDSIRYRCPSKHNPLDSTESIKIHFPEHPKIYPLDISVDAEQRDFIMNINNDCHSFYL